MQHLKHILVCLHFNILLSTVNRMQPTSFVEGKNTNVYKNVTTVKPHLDTRKIEFLALMLKCDESLEMFTSSVGFPHIRVPQNSTGLHTTMNLFTS